MYMFRRFLTVVVVSALSSGLMGGVAHAAKPYTNLVFDSAVTCAKISVHVTNNPVDDNLEDLQRVSVALVDTKTGQISRTATVPGTEDDSFDTILSLRFPAYSGRHYVALMGVTDRPFIIGEFEVRTNCGPRADIAMMCEFAEGRTGDIIARVWLNNRRASVMQPFTVSFTSLNKGGLDTHWVRAGRLKFVEVLLERADTREIATVEVRAKSGRLLASLSLPFADCR